MDPKLQATVLHIENVYFTSMYVREELFTDFYCFVYIRMFCAELQVSVQAPLRSFPLKSFHISDIRLILQLPC